MNLPRGLSDLLPWVLLAPAMVSAMRRPAAGDDATASEAVTVTLVVSTALFIGMLLIPGILPRYVLPLTAPMALGAAVLLGRVDERILPRWHRVNQGIIALVVLAALGAPIAAALIVSDADSKLTIVGYDWKTALPAIGAATIAFVVAGYLWSRRAVMLAPSYLAICSAAVMGVGSLLYGAVAPKWIAMKDDLRPLAVRIDKSLPSGAELIIYHPVYTPGFSSFFYIHGPHRFVSDIKDIPAGAEFVLARFKDIEKVRKRRPEYVATFDYERKGQKEFVLLQPLGEKSAK
jgi:4-amino-4-deoxy-L-arabinose transferase-like glycosyltransferase